MCSEFKNYLLKIYNILYSCSGTCTLFVCWIGITAFSDNTFVIEYGFIFPLKICSSLFFVDIPMSFHAYCLIVTPYLVIFSEFLILTPLMFIHKAFYLFSALYQCRKPMNDESINCFDSGKAKQLLYNYFSYSQFILNVISLTKDRKRLMYVVRCIFKCWLILFLYVLIIRLCFQNS